LTDPAPRNLFIAATNSDPDPVSAAQAAALLQVCMEVIENRWQYLYDVENFFHLQLAIVNEFANIDWNFTE
jgi:hypothetical protein